MARLIDADVMIEYLRKQLCDNCHEQKDWCDICDYGYLIDEMKKVPTVDPIKHGHWELSPFDGNWMCSKCGNKPYHSNMKNMNYCPNCGAKMDEVENAKG